MGGFTSVLGHAATGFEEARQKDVQRQFEQSQAMRQQHLDLLHTIANSPHLGAPLQQWAIQEGINGLTQDPSKPWKGPNWKTMPAPPGQQQAFTPSPMPTPPTGSGMGTTGPALPTAPGAGTAEPPPSPYHSGTWIKTPEYEAQEAAQATGAVTGAKETAGLEAFQKAYEGVKTRHPDWTPQQVFTSLGKPIPYGMMAAGFAGAKTQMTVEQARAHPEWKDLVDPEIPPGTMVDAVRTKDNRPLSVTPTTPTSTLPKVTSDTSSTTTPGGMTTTHSSHKTVSTQIPGGKPMPQPPSQGGGTAAKPSSGKPEARPDVLAAQDSLKMFGLPKGKLTDAQSIALQEVKKSGWDPVPAGSAAAQSRADAARSIYPLLDRAKQLIAQSPEALGPIPGRWSEFQKKIGSLSGPPRELANTLKSIYSIAGTMHGWRAIKVAEEFESSFGGLKDTPAAIINGLDAMRGTADAVVNVGYPALSHPPTPPAGGGKKQFYRVNGVPYDAVTHQEIK